MPVYALEPPLVGLATLLDVGHQLVLLHVLVRLAVQLEVCLELGVVALELALVRVPITAFTPPPGGCAPFMCSPSRSQGVRGELVADERTGRA